MDIIKTLPKNKRYTMYINYGCNRLVHIQKYNTSIHYLSRIIEHASIFDRNMQMDKNYQGQHGGQCMLHKQ